ncbi:conserved exported hypothetical protein [Sphingomonas sp. EC-HK361]|uniref:hypothetical protein n=1 Tax=Sphingomonas sp. EC-HK361 TaxID=2038397 RepID=UPI0012586908|nr:hypothetical protein [Sphingomonas sp. EC-HK361]VVT18715.1 conserved exported hypothetical protein [Sphingomonas sp. EC-HK361]
MTGLGLVALALSATASAQSPTFTPAQRAEGERDVAKAGKMLADKVRDTDGAKFRNVFIQKTTGKDGTEYVQLCGEINARNGYGGMSGFHKFMLIGDQVLIGGAGQIVNADDICGNGRGIVDTRDYTPELRKAFDANAGG